MAEARNNSAAWIMRVEDIKKSIGEKQQSSPKSTAVSRLCHRFRYIIQMAIEAEANEGHKSHSNRTLMAIATSIENPGRYIENQRPSLRISMSPRSVKGSVTGGA